MTLVRLLRLGSAAALVAVSVAACDNDPTGAIPDNGRTYGVAVNLGNGTVRSYVERSEGKPVEVGVELTPDALQGLPTSGDHLVNETVLTMPDRHGTPFQHVVLNWNPVGHEPPGIYDLPHFDFHFYTIGNVDRMAIMPTDPAYQTKAATFPDADHIPAGYIAPAVSPVPMMGLHWLDPASPELNGQPFTRTFIYGSWDGKLTFAEPMITKAFLETKPDVTIPVPMAARYSPAGTYPSAYAIRFNAGTGRYEVALTGLVEKS